MKLNYHIYCIVFFILIILPGISNAGTKGKNNITQPQSVYGSVSVKRWADNKKSAFTFSFDDSKISQFTYARPIIDSYGLKATFFVIAGEVTDSKPNWLYGFWWQFDSLAHEGHEIGSHTMTHPELDTLPVGTINQPGTLDYELYQSQQLIEQKIPGYKCVSLAYPYNAYNNQVIDAVSQFYASARQGGDYSNSPDITGNELYKINAIDIYFNHPRGTMTDDEAFNVYTSNVISQSIETGGWANYYAHDILPWDQISDTAGSDTTSVSTYFLNKLCNWVVQESDSNNIWEATFGNVTRYIKERENFNYSIVSSTSNQIIVASTIGTLDTSIYNYPLTVDITVPQTWKEVTITQGNNSVLDSSFYNGSDYVVRVHVIPGNSNVVLSSGSSYSITGHVYYDNAGSTPLSNVKIILSGSNGTDSTVTDNSGSYSFNDVVPGTYEISPSKSGGWGGVNSTDALIAAKYFLHQISLDTLQQKAGDVNGSGSVNSTDALLICNRFIHKITSFNIPDWIFSGNNQVTVTNQNVVDNIKGIAAGDVNSSLKP